MRRALLVWLACSLAGAVLLALPDDGPRLIAFSGAHGLTALDLGGVVLLVAGWLVMARRATAGRGLAAAASSIFGSRRFFAGLGAGLVIASVFADFAGWWAVGAAVLVAVQVVALAASPD